MRGPDIQQHELFSYKTLEERVPADHPLRLVLVVVNERHPQQHGRRVRSALQRHRTALDPAGAAVAGAAPGGGLGTGLPEIRQMAEERAKKARNPPF